MFTEHVRTILIFLALAHTSYALVDDAIDVIRLSKEIGESVLSTWNIIGKPLNVSYGVQLPLIRRQERLILSRLAQISHSIEKLETSIEEISGMTLMIVQNSGRGTRLELMLHEMADLLSRVASADRIMKEYLRLQHMLEISTLQDFAEWTVSHDPSALPGLLERIHSLIVPPHKHLLGTGMMQVLLDNIQVSIKINKI